MCVCVRFGGEWCKGGERVGGVGIWKDLGQGSEGMKF